MASFEQKIAAGVIRERGKQRLKIQEGEKTKKELEAERLFFWILSRIAGEIEKSSPKQRSYKLTIEEKYPFLQGKTILTYGQEEYHSQYVFGNDFNDVLIRVKCTISSMEGYHSYVLQPHNANQKAIIIVSIEL